MAKDHGVNKAQNYGLAEKEYFKNWNNCSSLILQIETVKGVNNLEEILVNFKKNIDGIMIGPYRLSGSMGIPGNLNSPQVLRVKDILLIYVKKIKLAVVQLSTFDKK